MRADLGFLFNTDKGGKLHTHTALFPVPECILTIFYALISMYFSVFTIRNIDIRPHCLIIFMVAKMSIWLLKQPNNSQQELKYSLGSSWLASGLGSFITVSAYNEILQQSMFSHHAIMYIFWAAIHEPLLSS